MDILSFFLTTLLPFLVVLGVVVFVHEFGHFQVARWLGIKIEAFSLGFGPQVVGWTSKMGVQWKISALPLGGYVKFVGDKDESGAAPVHNQRDERGRIIINDASGLFHQAPVWKRALVVFAGPAFNFIFAILAFGALYATQPEVVMLPKVGAVQVNSPAQEAGFKPGDLVLTADGRKIHSFQELGLTVMLSANKTIDFSVDRGGEIISLAATPVKEKLATGFGDDKQNQGRLGVEWTGSRDDVLFVSRNPVEALGRGVRQSWVIIDTTGRFVVALAQGRVSVGFLSGPLGMGQMAGKVTEQGLNNTPPETPLIQKLADVFLVLTSFAAVLSVSVGLINLVPLPVLDGGHLAFYAIEAARGGRQVSEKAQAISYKVGLAGILTLFAVSTFADLDRLGLFRLIDGAVSRG